MYLTSILIFFLKPFVIPTCRFSNPFLFPRPHNVAYFLQGGLRCVSLISIPLVVLEMVTNLQIAVYMSDLPMGLYFLLGTHICYLSPLFCLLL